MKECDIFMVGVKTYSDLSYIPSGVKTPNPLCDLTSEFNNNSVKQHVRDQKIDVFGGFLLQKGAQYHEFTARITEIYRAVQ